MVPLQRAQADGREGGAHLGHRTAGSRVGMGFLMSTGRAGKAHMRSGHARTALLLFCACMWVRPCRLIKALRALEHTVACVPSLRLQELLAVGQQALGLRPTPTTATTTLLRSGACSLPRCLTRAVARSVGARCAHIRVSAVSITPRECPAPPGCPVGAQATRSLHAPPQSPEASSRTWLPGSTTVLSGRMGRLPTRVQKPSLSMLCTMVRCRVSASYLQSEAQRVTGSNTRRADPHRPPRPH